MNRTHRISEIGRESSHGNEFCRTNGIVPLYRFDECTSTVKKFGQSEMVYDFIIEGEAQEFEFPDGEKALGYHVLYRWSTNPFTCIVKCSDVVCV